MHTADDIYKKLKVLQNRNRLTDQKWQDVLAARKGELDLIFPDMISEDFPKQIVANFVDAAARDLAESFAPLPSFNCNSPNMTSDAARKFADKRTKIVQAYVDGSKLAKQMLIGADQYLTYSRCVFYLEPDFETKMPHICVEDAVGGYAEWDRWGRVVSYTKRYYAEAAVLADMYPEHRGAILKWAKDRAAQGENQIEMVRYCDGHEISLLVIAEHPLLLEQVPNRLGEPPIVIACRPWLDPSIPKGQFDDVIWVQLARDILAKLQLQAVERQVQAPLALPNDVQELPYGPDAVLRTATPEKVRRVGLELPTTAFAQQELMLQEMRQGARIPEARSGGIDASIITGKGVEALMGTFDSQIATAHTVFQLALEDVVRLCLKMDEVYWPNSKKTIRGQNHGTPYEIAYTPSKDIKKDHTVDVSYGFASGMDPNRAVVMMLQLRAEKLFSRDYFARQLPFDYDVSSEFSKVQVEEGREALLQSMYALAQSIPALAQMGMDPAPVVHQMSMVIRGLQKGRAVEEVVSEVFAPEPVPASGDAGGLPGGPGGDGGSPGEVGGGLTESGLMRGVPQGQAGMSPGGRPDLSVMLAGLTGSGQPTMSASTMRRRRF